MAESYTLRQATPTPGDAQALLAVERVSLADSPYSADEVMAVLARPEHRAWLAFDGMVAVGFVSCIVTPTPAGPRLELDMVGVRPEHRGRGLASRLLLRAIAEAAGSGVLRVRGIVREDNLPSRRAFVRAGLRAVPGLREMRVYPIGGTVPLPLPAGYTAHSLRPGEAAHPPEAGELWTCAGPGSIVLIVVDGAGRPAALIGCLRVQTLSYEGLWIERLWTSSASALRAALRTTVEEAKRLALDEVGHLASPSSPSGADPRTDWLSEGYIPMGQYVIYERDSSGAGADVRPPC